MNFISAKDDNDEERVTHSKSDIMEILTNDKAGKVTEEFFKPLQNRYQNILEKLMNSSEFVFNYVDLFYYKCQNKSE